MSIEHITGLSAVDMKTVIAVADQVKRGACLRLPVEVQIGALARTTAALSDLLFLCINGDQEAAAAARELFTAPRGEAA